MDMHEATGILMARIQGLDPENASKIVGYLLIQDPSEKDMIRLAYGPDALLLSYINQGKAYAERVSTNPSPLPQSSPRILIPNYNGGFNFSDSSPRAAVFPSNYSPRPVPYDAVSGSSSSSNLGLSSLQLHGGYDFGDVVGPVRRQIQDQKPCMFYAKGCCKNGGNCKFSHGDFDGFEAIENEELVRMKVLQEQRFAALMADNDFINFLDAENQRYDFSPLGLIDGEDPSSRQIYLTFASDSTFNEEDVSAYFSTFGPVQDVRIPYQQKRMFGFVTFLYPETVKHILEIRNPHYVCDSRVLVKPYKDKKQLMERGECPGIDSSELLNNPIGPRLLIKKQKMMLRRKMEQEAVLQHSLELQRRRMMNLQLMGMRNEHHNHHYLPFQPNRAPISSLRQPRFMMAQNVSSDATNHEVLQAVAPGKGRWLVEGAHSSTNNNIDSGDKQWHVNDDDSALLESLEHVLLPDDLFASPTKASSEHQSVFARAPAEADDSASITTNTSSCMLPSSSNLGMASPCYFQMPRQEAIQMGKHGSD